MKPTIAFMADLNQTAFMGMQDRLLRRKNQLYYSNTKPTIIRDALSQKKSSKTTYATQIQQVLE
jgi:hypothetical protein